MPIEGGSLIFLETIRDDSNQWGFNAVAKERDTVVHEVGHALARFASHPVTKWPNQPSRYTPLYLHEIRDTERPAYRV